MARIETLDSLMARLASTKPDADFDRVQRDFATLTRRMDAGELPDDLGAAVVASAKMRKAMSRMCHVRRKGR